MKNAEKPFACEHCPKRFKIATWRDKHMELKHPGNGVGGDKLDHYEINAMREVFRGFMNLSAEGQAFVFSKLKEEREL